MKIAIIDTYYAKFLAHHVSLHPDVYQLTYSEQLDNLVGTCFGTADFYSIHLNNLGLETVNLIGNHRILQERWAKEHGVNYYSLFNQIPTQLLRLPILGTVLQRLPNLQDILLKQVETLKPDVLYCQDIGFIPPRLLHAIRKNCRLLIGQIASPLPPDDFLRPYDLILTSFPHFVSKLRNMGIASEYFRIAFEPRVLELVRPLSEKYSITFVGGFSRNHNKAIPLMEHLARHTDIQFFGYGISALDRDSVIRRRHRGEAWGLDMYSILASSHLTINRHIDAAENYANNMRLFEATGVGATLLTDQKDNLHELFKIGKEVVAYSNADEAVELIQHLVKYPEYADSIGKAGQARTLMEHTYEARMIELVDIIRRHLH